MKCQMLKLVHIKYICMEYMIDYVLKYLINNICDEPAY